MPFESTLVASWWSSLYFINISKSRYVLCFVWSVLNEHVVSQCDLSLLITDDWELQLASADLIDILNPASMAFDGVGTQSNQFDASLGEFWLELCEGTEFGGADWGVIFGVGEEDYPVVTDELMEVDGTVGGFGFEVRGG